MTGFSHPLADPDRDLLFERDQRDQDAANFQSCGPSSCEGFGGLTGPCEAPGDLQRIAAPSSRDGANPSTNLGAATPPLAAPENDAPLAHPARPSRQPDAGSLLAGVGCEELLTRAIALIAQAEKEIPLLNPMVELLVGQDCKAARGRLGATLGRLRREGLLR